MRFHGGEEKMDLSTYDESMIRAASPRGSPVFSKETMRDGLGC